DGLPLRTREDDTKLPLRAQGSSFPWREVERTGRYHVRGVRPLKAAHDEREREETTDRERMGTTGSWHVDRATYQASCPTARTTSRGHSTAKVHGPRPARAYGLRPRARVPGHAGVGEETFELDSPGGQM